MHRHGSAQLGSDIDGWSNRPVNTVLCRCESLPTSYYRPAGTDPSQSARMRSLAAEIPERP